MRRQRAFQFNARLCGVFSLATLLAAACALPDAPGTSAQSVVPPPLGTAAAVAILAGTTVTNTGNAVVNGDVGVWPGSAVIGFPPGIITGTLHVTDGPAMAAQSDTTVAYDGLAGLPCGTALTGTNLGGLTLATGVYCFTSSAQLTGTLTLQGDANAVFVFQIATGITTAPSSAVVMIGGAVATTCIGRSARPRRSTRARSSRGTFSRSRASAAPPAPAFKAEPSPVMARSRSLAVHSIRSQAASRHPPMPARPMPVRPMPAHRLMPAGFRQTCRSPTAIRPIP